MAEHRAQLDAEATPRAPAPTLQLLTWLTERPRSYAETLEVWKTSCPRLATWEDALADGLIRVMQGRVVLTPAGAELLNLKRLQNPG